MATQTSNYNLVKPAANETIDISQINGNMDIIDGAMAGLQGSFSGVLRFTSQALTDPQKEQARTNIAALGASDVADVVRTSAQSLTAAQQTQARTNIGAASQTGLESVAGILSGMFRAESYSVTVDSIAVGPYNITRGDFGITDIDGYRPVGLISYNMNSWLNMYSVNVAAATSETRFMSVRNFGTSALSNTTISISILWAKTDLFP